MSNSNFLKELQDALNTETFNSEAAKKINQITNASEEVLVPKNEIAVLDKYKEFIESKCVVDEIVDEKKITEANEIYKEYIEKINNDAIKGKDINDCVTASMISFNKVHEIYDLIGNHYKFVIINEEANKKIMEKYPDVADVLNYNYEKIKNLKALYESFMIGYEDFLVKK